MIFEAIMSHFIYGIMGLLDLLPTVTTDFLNNWEWVKSVIIDIVTGLGCIIPFAELLPLFQTFITIQVFRLVLAIVLRIKSFIPFFGG